jgi:HAE1 family hydrophobic/amphiphilic exporter-1
MNRKEQSSLLPRISVNRPVTVTMCLVALLVVGIVAYFRVPVKLFPSGFTPAFLYTSIQYSHRNSTPQESEQQLARPLEEQLRTIKGIKRIRTYSNSRGVDAPLEFQPDTDMDMAYNQLMDRIERLKLVLPEEARDQVFVWKFNSDSWEVLWMGVSLAPDIQDPFQFLDVHVRRRLERVDGVARLNFWGVDEKEVMIELDQDRLEARGVNLAEMVQVLQQDNFALSAGHVREGGKQVYVRSMARYQSLDEIKNIKVHTRAADVRLGDVADVVYDVPEKSWYQRIDGQTAVSIGVFQESGANVVDVGKRVVEAIKEIENDPLVGGKIKFNVFFNQGDFISSSIHNLETTGLWGGLFAALILLFFLRAIRMTAIITLSIPLCVMITVTVLYFIDWSLNLLTMMGLMVGVGMVVDNAIVILENIYRMRAKGLPAKEAAVAGASEVSLAITMATLTTVVVFLPLMLMNGNVELTFFLARIGVPVIVALVGSLFVALIFIPQAACRFGGQEVKVDPKSIQWVRKRYERMLVWVLAHRRDAFLIALVLFGTIVVPVGGLQRSDSGSRMLNDFRIQFDFSKDFALEETSDVIDEVETFLEAHREEYGIRTMRVWYRTGYGNIHVFLGSSDDEWWYSTYKMLRSSVGAPVQEHLDRKSVIKDLQKKVPQFVGVRVRVENQSGNGNDPRVSLNIYGDDVDVLAGLLTEVERRLQNIPSVLSVDSDLERANDEVHVTIDRDRAQKLGLSAQTVGRSIGFALQGVQLPFYQADKREIRVRLYLEKLNKSTAQHLKALTFPSKSGEQIPLLEFAKLNIDKGRGTIRREDGKTRLRVSAVTTKDDIKGLYAEIDKALEGFSLPRGYSWDKGERYSKLQEEDATMSFAMIMAVTCVFLLMGVLFESFILPFSVLLSIPFAFLGVYWTLFATGTPMEGLAMVGVIVLIGVVVNNAIVLIDMINRLRGEGMGRSDAILEAGSNRFRPILMTTFTTLFGVLPMALGNSTVMGQPYAPMGRTMMGGLISSTFLTLLLVPLFYTFFDDLRLALQRIASSAWKTKVSAPITELTADD